MTKSRTQLRSAALGACVAFAAQFSAAPAGAQGVTGQLAQLEERDIARWAACSFFGLRAPDSVVRREVRQAGYRNIRNIQYVNRQRPKAAGCGFYRMRANQGGRDFVVFADASTGRIVDRRPAGRQAGDRPRRAQMNDAQARRTLRRLGYDDIRNLRYLRVGNRDFYQARVRKGRAEFVVRLDDENGRIVSQRRVATLPPKHRRADMNAAQVRQALRRDGYRRISGIDYRRRGNDDFYVARAWLRGQQYRLVVSDESGDVINRRPVQ